jgi:guanylate kinase
MKRGAYILVVGPTGSGKNTLIQAAREAIPGLAFAVSATTRLMRAGEVDGVHYHFLTTSEFMTRVDAGLFLEWAEYGGNLYGTLRSEIEPAIESGKVILSDIELQGVRQIIQNLPEGERVTLFIDAGPWEELVTRITARGPMGEEDIARRRAHYDEEMAFKDEADYIVYNGAGERESAQEAFISIVRKIKGY